ncbi:MAG: GtrA family protein [Oscillospiraceae bacterium]|nr:GtrA family protein [Oscillospiraceae bacterium]
MKTLYNKYKELVIYVAVGLCTTAFSWGLYLLFSRLLGWDENLSNVVSVILAIIFAYFANKIIVFRVPFTNARAFAREFILFAGGRGVSMLLEIGGFYLLFDVLRVPDLITKLILAVVVMLTNYVISKLLVFRKRRDA